MAACLSRYLLSWDSDLVEQLNLILLNLIYNYRFMYTDREHYGRYAVRVRKGYSRYLRAI